MIISIQQPEFFPWLGYFDKISRVDQVVILDNVQFKKRYYENRNKVRTVDGWCWIRTPVLTKGRQFQNINSVKINNDVAWKKKLINTLRHNYRRAPFWDKEGENLCQLINRSDFQYLKEFNLAIIEFLVAEFGIAKPLRFSSSLETKKRGSELILEICHLLGCNDYLSGTDGRKYLDEKAFRRNGIKVRYQKFVHPTYNQHQSGAFIPDMSAVDMLFNLGNGCKDYFYNRV